MRGGKKRRMTDGGRVCACLSARELIRAGVCVHLTELLLLDELVDLGIGILEGLEGLGEDGFLSREGSGTSSVPMKPMGGGACCVCSGPIDRWPRGRVSDRTASSTAKPGSGRFVAARDRGNGTRTIFALIRNLARGFRAGRSRARARRREDFVQSGGEKEPSGIHSNRRCRHSRIWVQYGPLHQNHGPNRPLNSNRECNTPSLG